MTRPTQDPPHPTIGVNDRSLGSSEDERTFVGDGSFHEDPITPVQRTVDHPDVAAPPRPSTSHTREQASRLEDNLVLLQAERDVADAASRGESANVTYSKSSASRRVHEAEPADDFEMATKTMHEKTAKYTPPENPTTKIARLIKRVHRSVFFVRYLAYITPLVVLILIPLLLGALVYPRATVGGVRLMWFSIWLEIVWLTLWAGRIVADAIPYPVGIIASIFSNNSQKWKDLAHKLEIPATLFFWWLAIQISFLPTMRNHHLDANKQTKPWQKTTNRVITAIFVAATLNFAEKIVVQLILMDFHQRTYSDRIDAVKFQVATLTKLYQYSRTKIQKDDDEFAEKDGAAPGSGSQTPMQMLSWAQKSARDALNRVGDVAGKVAQDFTGQRSIHSSDPHQVIVTLLRSPRDSQTLARRLYHTFARPDSETFLPEDLRPAFETDDETDAAFQMFDRDLNGDVSMEELEAVCVEIGHERKSITNALKDLDSVVAKLDHVLVFIVVVIALLVFLTLISTSTATVLASAGSTMLALSWLFSATAQEFLQSVIFVFVKHPFDVGDRVTIYGNTGALGKGDDYYVKAISLLYTEFKKLEGHVVQAPNSYLNTLFVLNMRRSGALAEGIPIILKFGTTLDQIDALRQRLLEFVLKEKRDFQGKILTELRHVEEVHSIRLNVVFFFKSNHQNELLRLQRRNKFICALMVSMDELGIEGPRMRLPGQKESGPFHLAGGLMPGQHPATGLPPSGPDRSGDAPGASPGQFGPVVDGRHASVSAGSGSRPHAESASSMSRRVDFTLGMRDMASGDLMDDLYDDPTQDRSRRLAAAASTAPGRGHHSEDGGSMARTTSRDTGGQSQASSAGSPARAESGSRTGTRHRLFGRKRANSRRGDEGDLESGAVMPEIPETQTPPSRTGTFHGPPRSTTAQTEMHARRG